MRQYNLLRLRRAGLGFKMHAPREEIIIPSMLAKSCTKKCRDDYRNDKAIARDLSQKQNAQNSSQTGSPVKTRSRVEKPFNYRTDCLLCGQSAGKNSDDVFAIRSFECQKSLIDKCSERGDKWGQTVKSRIESVNDLHAADAVYHQQCSVNFRTKKNIPKKRTLDTLTSDLSAKAAKKGRPVDEEQADAFLRVAQYLEDNDDEQITLTDLCHRMHQFLQDSGFDKQPYTEKHLRQKLEDHFGDAIIVTCIRGKANVVTFKSTAEKILRQFSKSKEKDVEAEKLRIIKTAAMLLLSDIRAMDTSKDNYPSSSDIASLDSNLAYLPASVRLFLNTLFNKKKDCGLKTASIGQALVQATRPKVLLSPLQLGLGVEVHHLFGSKYLVEHLNKLGFSLSYAEVKRFEQCAALTHGTDIDGIIPTSCIQFVADNVDHNIRTLDGTGTFHGMGMIAAVTPFTRSSRSIKRDESMTAERVKEAGKIPIKFFRLSNSELKLKYQLLRKSDTLVTPFIDLLWKVSWPLRSPRPGWSGMMQAVCNGHYPGQSYFTFLPMIDMDPTDMSCVYTTLNFVSSLADKYQVTPIITFDQPLWWKAKVIITSEPENSPLRSIILKLGGFHTEMSFLGCIGRLMAGSGLQELLEVVFAPTAVMHMLSGKSVARAVRGHFLVDAVLNALLGSIAFNYCLEFGEEQEGTATGVTEDEDFKAALQLYDQVLGTCVQPEDLDDHPELHCLQNKLIQAKTDLSPNRTSRLWLQYMEMIDILRHFLRAERTGNWEYHLHALKEMLPFLAAAGHNLYTKSVYIYVQDMYELQKKHPNVFSSFMAGQHVVRRSDRFWAGLSSDLAIEQLLMRSVKSAGGLTRGRGMSESQRSQWLLSMPACGDMNNAMQEVAGMEFITSDQHADISEARQKRDDKDMRSLLRFLSLHSPFKNADQSLRNICTGMVADSSVNADSAKEVGENIIQDMVGKKVTEHKFRKKEQVIPMIIKRCAKIDGENIHVDPQLLFQRLITAASTGQSDAFQLSSVFEYELSSLPASLFETSGMMRDATKSKLLDALPSLDEGNLKEDIEDNIEFVLDGGSLLHQLPWRKGDTFGQICQMYADYLSRRYKRAIVVFDGYSSAPSTKDAAHLRRSGGIGPEVRGLQETTQLCTRKDMFLSNPSNKQAFIFLLGQTLERYGCHVLHSEGDADTLIVKTALKCAANSTTYVIGEDTDLLVLLCFHTKYSDKPVFFRSDKKTGSKQRVWHIQKLKQSLKPDTVNALPFLHAVNGCDTTSRLYGIGKSAPLKKMDDPVFVAASVVFCTKNQTSQKITSEGEKALVCLYNGQQGVNLNMLRYHRFCEKAASSFSTVQVHSLPPTSAAAKYHSLRVYHQVQEWVHLSKDLDPEVWGWQLNSGCLEPRTTDLHPAPDFLLRFIRCNCKTDCKSKSCTCRKHGLECSLACGECKGLSCTNSSQIDVDLDMADLDSGDAGLPDLGDLSSIL